MPELSQENIKLFQEQVDDHVSKLADLMGHSTGQSINPDVLSRACFAGRLLEGSTKMLGFEEWSTVLTCLRQLLDMVKEGHGLWDENQSQVVSEILEIEERVSDLMVEKELDEIYDPGHFEGLRKEVNFLIEEYDAVSIDTTIEEGFSESSSVYLEESSDDVEGEESEERFSALDRLITLFELLKNDFDFCLDNHSEWKGKIGEIGRAYGESEFYMSLVKDVINRISKSERSFSTDISSNVVVQGIRDIINLYGELKEWDVRFSPTSEEFILDRDIGSDLVRIVESCLYDISSLSEINNDDDLNLELDIHSLGSYIQVVIRDNFENYLRDPEVDNDDIAAYYKGLIAIRNILRRLGGLLDVEPDKGRGGRFKFTLPKTYNRTEMHIFRVSDMELCVPLRMVEEVIEFSEDKVVLEEDRYYIVSADSKIPVFSMGELASEEVESRTEYGNMVVTGIAEERIAIFCDDRGYKVESIRDQLVEEDWASISRFCLQIGERACPVLDMELVMNRVNYLRGLDVSYAGAEPVSADGV